MPEHTDTQKEKILVYIRAEQQKTLHRRQVCINDIASVYCKYSRYEGQIKGMIVDKIRGKKSVISVMKIIEQITEIYDDAQVISIGEPEVLVEYDDNSKNKILEALKVAAVCILIFFGSAFTIMAFNNDISISGVFEHFYKQIKSGRVTKIPKQMVNLILKLHLQDILHIKFLSLYFLILY